MDLDLKEKGVRSPFLPLGIALGIGAVLVALDSFLDSAKGPADYRWWDGTLTPLTFLTSVVIFGLGVRAAKQRARPKPLIWGLVTLAASIALPTALGTLHLAPGFDDPASWAVGFYLLAGLVTGLVLLVAALVHWTMDRRRGRST